MVAYVRRVQASAHRALGNLADATRLLEGLVLQPTSDINTLRALIELSRCHCDAGNYTSAIAAGEKARRMLDDLGISGVPEETELAAALARAYRHCGAVGAASTISRTALEEAGGHTTQIDQASAYWRASVAEWSANGATPAAIELAQAALALIDLDAERQSIEALIEIASS